MTQLNFKGLVCRTSPQNSADGNCEEIINLRLRDGSWRVVGKKQPIIEGVDYEKVYVHKYRNFENFIGLKDSKVIWFALRKGNHVENKEQEICTTSGDVEFNQLNNILLVKDRIGIAKAIFRADKYSVSLVKLPNAPILDVQVKLRDEHCSKIDLSYNKFSQVEIDTIKEALYGLIKQCEKNRFYEGRVFLTATYQLFDGSETKPTPPLLVELGNYDKDAIKRENLSWGDPQHSVTVRSGTFWAEIPVGQLNLKVNNTLGEEFKDTITKINVYATPVYSFYNSDSVNLESAPVVGSDGLPSSMVGERKLKLEEIEKSLFFQVLSIDLKKQNDEYEVVSLDDVTTNKTLRVDASGWMNTTGRMFVYNNRLHLFNTKQEFVEDANLSTCLEGRYKTVTFNGVMEGDPVYNYDFTNSRTLTGIFYLKMEMEDARVVEDFRVELLSSTPNILTGLTTYKVRIPRFLAFPDSRAYKVDLYDGNSFVKSLDLKASATYNYSYVLFDVNYKYDSRPVSLDAGIETRSNPNVPTIIDDSIIEYTDATASEIPDFNSSPAIEDNMNLIVSEVLNPYYFPPEHSYLMPGEIINLAVNTEQISTSQVGQFPLYVFTTEGIYALQVGDGKVLYSNVIPISAEVAVKGSDVLPTKYGVIFVTDKGLKLISGQEVIDFSEPIDGAIDMNVRNSRKYVSYNNTPGLYNILPYLSAVPFSEYSQNAVMGYDITENEVIVSNPDYNYSYVFSLKTNTWHKITEVFSDFNRYLGLQSYESGAVSAKASIWINCSVSPGQTVRFTSAVSLSKLKFDPGVLKVSVGIPGGSSELFSCEVDETMDLMNLLIERIDVPERYFKMVVDERKVYTIMPYTALILEHSMFPDPQYYPFVAEERELSVASEGVGETFSISLAGREFSHITDGRETISSIGVMIGDWIKSLNLGYEVQLEDDSVRIIAQPGSEGNNGKLSCIASPHVSLNSSDFKGGADVSTKQRVCDIRKEQDEPILTYFQTRPISLGSYGFTKLRHTAIRGEFKPIPGQGNSFFITASDNLIKWTGVLRQCFMSSVSHVVLPQNPYSFRYFVIAGGGYVNPGHTLSLVEFEGENKFDNRLR